jgi:uncharacterized membrane protein
MVGTSREAAGAPATHGLRTWRPAEAAPAPRSSLVPVTEAIEGAAALDRPAAVVDRVARAVAPAGPVHDALTGRWLGHALHPLMTDLPIGLWTSASLLDLVGGKAGRRPADRLLALGILAALPTAATGLAEWLHAEPAARRVGVVHANANGLGVVLYTASLVARCRGHRARGVLYALAGATAASAAGYLGGHLAFARRVGTRDPAYDGAAGTR